MAEKEGPLKILKRQRGHLRAVLTYTKKFLSSLDSSVTLTELIYKQSKLDECWLRFKDIQPQIQELMNIDEDEIDEDYNEFMESYYELGSQLEAAIHSLKTPEICQELQVLSTTENVKLPDMPLPTFSGNYDEWVNFHDTFDSLIHESKSLSKIQKFHYLRSSLTGVTGDALQAIKEIKLSAANYESAWNTLKLRFKNDKLIIKAHILGILNFRKIENASATNLKHLYDAVNNHITALRNVGEPVHQWDSLLVFVIIQKLDTQTRERWQARQTKRHIQELNDTIAKTYSLESTKKPYSYKELMEFLYEQILIQETKADESQAHKRSTPKYQINKIVGHVSLPKKLCGVCKGEHATYYCEKLLKLRTHERISKTRECKLCLNCLRAGHISALCKSPVCCKHCNKRHHSILHIYNNQPTISEGPRKQVAHSEPEQNQIPTNVVAGHSRYDEEVILATATIIMYDSNHTAYPCRALLDCGSQANFITQTFASALGLQLRRLPLHISGIGNSKSSAQHITTATIASRLRNYNEIADFLVLKRITVDLPTTNCKATLNDIPREVELADEEYYKTRGIDVLLGADIFYSILRDGHIQLGEHLPMLHNTALGWIVSGKMRSPVISRISACASQVGEDAEELTNLLASSWKVEEVPEGRAYTDEEEEECARHYNATVLRQADGRFVVTLPFHTDPKALGDSKEQAIKRFVRLERKLQMAPKLKQDYQAFLNEYLRNNEMELIKEDEKVEPPQTYYLPHHPVLKEDSSTTKVRVVFDASARTTTGLSLNDLLMIGPTIQRDVVTVLLAFRTHAFVFTADIKQMYRKVLMHESQRDFQRIIWRETPTQPLQTYRLRTVTYGTAAAPYLAIKTLMTLADQEKERYPAAAEAVKRDFYVNDVLTGCDDLVQALNVQSQLMQLMKSGGFELRKWCANHPSLLKNIPPKDQEEGFEVGCFGAIKTIKTLGIYWQPSSDTFRFYVNLSELPNVVTKRNILSDISRIFDPIGLLSPVVISGQLIMQDLWKNQECGWDDAVPDEIQAKWKRYRSSLQKLNSVTIERRVMGDKAIGKHELHGFADASERAYGACLYIKTILNDHTKVELLCSKSRVAPLKLAKDVHGIQHSGEKCMTIPKLELCGAVLLARLLQRSLPALEGTTFSNIFLWSDSTIVLHWIRATPKTWETFIGNRVAQIQELTPNCIWRHVRSADNPADLISRSLDPELLLNCEIWWHGPHWLTRHKDDWPESVKICGDIKEGRRKQAAVHCNVTYTHEILNRFSNWNRIIRITALCQRFSNNIHHKRLNLEVSLGPLTVEELTRAETFWVMEAQKEFAEDIERIRLGKEPSNRLKSLTPFLDEHGVLRVGGRLQNSIGSVQFKHPALLPKKHIITTRIAETTHIDSLHCGPQALLATLRTKYWPINGKNLTRSIVSGCMRCNRVSPKSAKHLMGELPAYRVQPTLPFKTSGVDYCGPFYYRRTGQRRASPLKAYVAVFICMTTKAMHIELVPDLTTKKFLEALERVMARRGPIEHIYSDNATYFVGAKNELKFASTHGITFHFIPPRSPHFGGLWEAGVKTVKGHIKRVLLNTILPYDELETLLVKIEACVNSRPLTALSNDPNDVSPLTPAHFLVGQPLRCLQHPDVADTPINRVTNWQRIQQLYQGFWRRWSTEYLNTLQQRTKWTKDCPSVRPDTLVLLKDDFRPPLQWDLGRIVEVHKGADGRARVASVRTARGVLKRAVRKLCILPPVA